MDMAEAMALVPELPGLDDGTGQYVRALFGALAGRK